MTATTFSDTNKNTSSTVMDTIEAHSAKLDDALKMDLNSGSSTALKHGTTTGAQSIPRLANFYAGKTILITGVTGFIGKVCLVKVMKSFTKTKRVYVMLRPKKGMSPQQRFNKMLNEAPFNDSLLDFFARSQSGAEKNSDLARSSKKEEAKLDWSKVVAVEGDMSREMLGFSNKMREELTTEVDIIFNIAASVQFDAPLKQNLRDNYSGVKNLLKLALNFERLISFVHVSTFYTNSHRPHVEEEVLPLDLDCEKLSELISWMPDNVSDSVGDKLMENRPNTYILTKAMAENLIKKHQGRLPIAIVRPSIVLPSMRDPCPGWVDNVNGPMGLGTLASLGILRTIDWNYYGVADMIPVDFVVNTMLAVGERTPRLYPNEIKVYNCSTSSLNPVTWGEMFECLRAESIKAPPYKMLRIPIKPPKIRRANPIVFKMTKLSEILFAYFIDFILTICGQKPVLTRLTSKLHHGYEILKPFTTTEYTCSNDNLQRAYEELSNEDKKEFDFNIKAINWEITFTKCYHGARSRLLKEDLSNLPGAVFKMRILWVVEQVFKLMMLALVGWNLYKVYGYCSQQV